MEVSTPSGAGRPRDPEISARALGAALDVYGEAGWAAFTMDAVAARARIGKAALYLRWPSKEALLVDALDAASPHVQTEGDLGPRDLLIALGRQMYERYTGRYGPAVVRLAIESAVLPPTVVAPIQAQMLQEWHNGIAALDAAAGRGELRADRSPPLVIEALGGAILMRALYTQDLVEVRAVRDPGEFVAGVVDMLLGAPITPEETQR